MPYKYVEPEVAYFDNNLEIYHTYAEDDYDLRFEYWFTLDPDTAGEEESYEFDIREFEEYDDYLTLEENFDILTMKGYITKEGWKYKKEDEFKRHK